jgi:hypothetical protein
MNPDVCVTLEPCSSGGVRQARSAAARKLLVRPATESADARINAVVRAFSKRGDADEIVEAPPAVAQLGGASALMLRLARSRRHGGTAAMPQRGCSLQRLGGPR